MIQRIALLCVCLLVTVLGYAQQYFPISHSELTWKTIASKYADIIYHDPLEEKARMLGSIYDQIYEPICEYYNYYPKRLEIILKDTDDYSNGAAYFYDDKIEIWATALDFPFRGDHQWLKDVISHEFTHIVQIQSAMKWNKKIPAVYFQLFGYEDVRRPDVLYGFPDLLVSVPLMSISVPAWLAEGTAQYNLPGLYYDFWDSHRDMILRSRMLDSTLLTFDEMVGFNKNSLDAETVYNQGYSLSSYLVRQFGKNAPKQLSKSLSKIGIQTISGAMKDAFGKSGEGIYADWVSENLTTYRNQLKPIESEIDKGQTFHDSGFINWADDYDGESKLVVIRTNEKKDYTGQVSVQLLDTTGKVSETIDDIKPNSRIRFLSFNDKKYLLFSQISKPNKLLSSYSDLYLYDLKAKEIIQLTEGARLFSPLLIDEQTIAAIRNSAGEKSIVRVRLPKEIKKEMSLLTSEQITINNLENEMEFYTLDYNRKKQTLVLDASIKHGRQIYLLGIKDWLLRRITSNEYDSRDPRWVGENQIIYSSDRTGIFNIYEQNIADGLTIQRSQVVGGAFAPLWLEDSRYIASSFSGYGYQLKIFSKDKSYQLKPNMIYPYENNMTSKVYQPISLNDYSYQPLSSEPLLFQRKNNQGFSFYPVYRIDAYSKQFGSYSNNIKENDFKSFGRNILRDSKFGFYTFSTDALDRMQFSASVFVAPFTDSKSLLDIDSDIYLDLNIADQVFKKIIPIRWGIDYYHLTRNTYNTLTYALGADTAQTNIVYKLNQFDVYSLIQLGLVEQIKINYSYILLSAATEPFYWAPIQNFISGSSDDYYKAHQLTFNYSLKLLEKNKESEIAPVGRELSFTVGYERGELLKDYDVDQSKGVLVRIYSKHDLWKFSLGYKEHIQLPFEKQTLSLWLRGSSVLTTGNERFFYNYVGGFLGMRGYPFYAIGGYELAHLQLNWKFPLIQHINYSVGNIYFNRLYMSIYSDIGNAWLGSFPGLSNFKKDLGAELRLETTAFYLLPLRFFISATYGVDQVVVRLPKEFQAVGNKQNILFGKEWLFHVGLLFNFDLGLE